MVHLKRPALIATGIGLLALCAIAPLSSLAESIAANTQDVHPAVSIVDTASDIASGEALQYFMMDSKGNNQPEELLPASKDDSSSPSLFEDTLLEKLSIPGITTPLATSEDYVVQSANGKTYTIKVNRESISGFASLVINNHEVLKFRSGYDVLDAYDRAQLVAQRLYGVLNGSFDPRSPKSLSIRPVIEDGHYVIKMDDDLLATIDLEAAAANGNSEKAQALVWTNQIRKAFDIEALREEPVISIASVVQSPGVSKKYNLPLSTAYFKNTGKLQSGQASWYGPGFHGRRASDGSRFDMNKMTAAHRYLPFGTVVRVKNNRNGKQCLVQITDRGPFAHGRIIDLSKAAANAIGMLGSGTASVTIEVMAPGKPENIASAKPRLIGSGASTDIASR